MTEADEFKAFYEDSVLGSFDEFQDSTGCTGWDSNDISECIDAWNLEQVKPLIALFEVHSGLELSCDRRLFVIAANPKPSSSPYRVTHYFEQRGAICECPAESVGMAIIDTLINYPEAIHTPDKLDHWMNDAIFVGSFV